MRECVSLCVHVRVCAQLTTERASVDVLVFFVKASPKFQHIVWKLTVCASMSNSCTQDRCIVVRNLVSISYSCTCNSELIYKHEPDSDCRKNALINRGSKTYSFRIIFQSEMNAEDAVVTRTVPLKVPSLTPCYLRTVQAFCFCSIRGNIHPPRTHLHLNVTTHM